MRIAPLLTKMSQQQHMSDEEDTSSSSSYDKSRVNVFVRVRPCKSGKKEEKCVRTSGDKAVRISVTRNKEKTFFYDRLFGEKVGQQAVYDAVGRPVIQDVLKGYNGCIMAYGQTGAGKTHSLLNMSSGGGGGGGEGGATSSSSSSASAVAAETSQPGLVPRIVTDLYIAMAADFMGMFTVSVAMCQIYNEQIDDLLKPKNANLRLTLNGKDRKTWEVEGLSWYTCKTPEYLLSVISNGRKRLVYAETEMNKHSSRSHAVLMIKVQRHNRSDVVNQEKKEAEAAEAEATSSGDEGGDEREHESKKTEAGAAGVLFKGRQGILSIIDLAGSERVKKSKSSGLQFMEAKKINTSLLVLGQCVQALAFKKGHVPYRDSVLTKFLEPSLSGTSRVNLLVCVAPEKCHANESQAALEFAYRAMSVPCSPTLNEMTVCASPRELIADLASSAASVIKLEQTEALQRITEQNMRMEEEIQTLKDEKSRASHNHSVKATELRELEAKYNDLSAKFKGLEKDAVQITAEAMMVKQDLRAQREKAKRDGDEAHELNVKLERENEMLRRHNAKAMQKIESLQEELVKQEKELQEHIGRIQWIEDSIDYTQSSAAEIEGKMESMVEILDQTSTKIEGLEDALAHARDKAQTLGRRCENDQKQWGDEKSVLHGLVNNMQRQIKETKAHQRQLESQMCCSAITEELLWKALTIAKDKQIEAEKENVKEGLEVSAKSKSDHIDSLDEWLKAGIPVIKWGRNNKPYQRLVRVSADGKSLEWMPMNKSRWVLSTEQVRTFPLSDITSINTSEGGKDTHSLVYSVLVGLPERVVRMDLSSSQGFLWFETLKSRGLRIT